jgi:tetratricopeptide (TPR) repeat protein
MRNRFALFLALLLFIPACAGAPEDARLADKAYHELTAGFILDAEKDCLRALAINPDNAYALINLGVIYKETGRYGKAREVFEKVVRLDPKERPRKTEFEANSGKSFAQIAKEKLQTLP